MKRSEQPSLLRRLRRGANTIEAAFTIPALVIMILGILEYGWYFMINMQYQDAARAAARAAAFQGTEGNWDTVARSVVEENFNNFGFSQPEEVYVNSVPGTVEQVQVVLTSQHQPLVGDFRLMDFVLVTPPTITVRASATFEGQE